MSEQTKLEEQLNAWSHGIGVVLGVLGLVLLIINVNKERPFDLFSVIVYGLSIIILFTASTLYHSVLYYNSSKPIYDPMGNKF